MAPLGYSATGAGVFPVPVCYKGSMSEKYPKDELSGTEIAARMERGLKGLVTSGPKTHKPTRKKRRASHKGGLYKSKSRAS